MKRPSLLNSAAFSLIEIVLAIGVVSFAFVGVVGLLPAGMDVFRKSMNASVGVQIVQRVLTEAQQTDFNVLTGQDTQQPAPAYYEYMATRYFDDEGTELPTGQAAKSLYHVHTVVQNLPKFPDGAGKNTIEMNDLATVVVQVAVNPAQRPIPKDGTTLLWTEAPGIQLQNYPVLVSHHD